MNIVLTGSLGNISKPLAAELIIKGHLVIWDQINVGPGDPTEFFLVLNEPNGG
ncbi:hypothetical protein [Flexithrix dorotheae]|uniref:hypothetical protein n=1 Tax=Flexithrix dorotheae TaxID=70993 RepID=UPI000369B72E|nr:hypothetical protein [Flexithrix dorotheae]